MESGSHVRLIDILLVEDNAADIRLIVETVKRSKILNRLHIALDGEEAIAFLRQQHVHQHAPRPDVILLDINLPKKSGLEVLAEIKADPVLRSIPVAILTSSDADRDIRSAYDAHANCYLKKPLGLEEFGTLIQSFENFWFSLVKLPHGDTTPSTVTRLLLVEDVAGDATLVRAALAGYRHPTFDVLEAATLSQALKIIKTENIDAILLDLNLPDSQGLETLNKIQSATPETPIIVLSGMQDERLALQAVQNGAQDFLLKGEGDGNLLRRALRYAIEIKRSETRLNYLANFDSLTGLPNRTQLMEALRDALIRAKRQSRLVGVLFIDLDHLKRINDSLGHGVGDVMIKAAAQRMSACLRRGDTLARLGGDEFVVIAADMAHAEDAWIIVSKIIAALTVPLKIEDQELLITASIGVSFYPDNGETPETLVRNADVALYRAKDAGRNNCQFYSPDMQATVQRRLELETELRHALERGEQTLHYQPIVHTESGRIVGAEALLRWRHPVRGWIEPEEFIPVADETGLIVALGEWVLSTAFQQCSTWKSHGSEYRIAVNLSSRQLQHPRFQERFLQTVACYGLAPAQVEIELTESSMQNVATVAVLHSLKEAGFRIAIDDFGIGYSSLNYLRRFPVNVLKIDRSFVHGVLNRPNDAAIVKTIITLAHNLNMEVVAEGVETQAQLEFLRDQGCDLVQGFLFSRATPAENLMTLLQQKTLHPHS